MQLLGGMTAQAFLDQYWQKKPLLISQALPDFVSPLTAEELAGLACEEEVESRLIIEKGAQHPWQLNRGPFSEQDFAALPATHWTLLVQEVNKHVQEAADLLELFRFIPDWRIDDVMVSFAPAHGSVGPHVDSYDVFLLQAAGRRHWAIDTRAGSERTLVPNLDLQILAHFEPEHAWVLEPGDMLYLPPGVPHHGIALDNCQTWSIGFHAPSHADMVMAMAGQLAHRLDPEDHYADPDLKVQDNPGEISPPVLDKTRALVRSIVDRTDPTEWFGCLVTENRSMLVPQPPDEPLDEETFQARLRSQGILYRNDLARFAFATGEDVTFLFVDGHAHSLPPRLGFVARLLCGHRSVTTADLAPALTDNRLMQLLTGLYNHGYVQLPD